MPEMNSNKLLDSKEIQLHKVNSSHTNTSDSVAMYVDNNN